MPRAVSASFTDIRNHFVEEPELKETISPLESPFAFNLSNALLLGGAATVMLTLVVLNMLGVIH
jgi:hypothetical protein